MPQLTSRATPSLVSCRIAYPLPAERRSDETPNRACLPVQARICGGTWRGRPPRVFRAGYPLGVPEPQDNRTRRLPKLGQLQPSGRTDQGTAFSVLIRTDSAMMPLSRSLLLKDVNVIGDFRAKVFRNVLGRIILIAANSKTCVILLIASLIASRESLIASTTEQILYGKNDKIRPVAEEPGSVLL